VPNLVMALGEEIGWRGLLVPELAKITSFTKTALISGIIWAAWHMPVIFLTGYYQGEGTPVVYSAACFAVMIVSGSFAYAWLRLKSGSLWTAAFLHASHNVFLDALSRITGNTGITAYIIGEFGIGLALTSVVVAYVFWRMQKDDRINREKEIVSNSPYLQESA
jgi:membrane protease YdiL (CAAX protease family)